jgi:hypothetical protein
VYELNLTDSCSTLFAVANVSLNVKINLSPPEDGSTIRVKSQNVV